MRQNRALTHGPQRITPKKESFIKPYLRFLDGPDVFTKPYDWLFNVLALVCLLIPVGILYRLIASKIFEGLEGKYIFLFVLSLLVITAASIIAFQMWLNRKKPVVTDKITCPIVIDALGHLVYVFCEVIATWIGIVGTLVGLFQLIFGVEEVLFYLFVGDLIGSYTSLFLMPLMMFGIFPEPEIVLVAGSLIGGYLGVILSKLCGFLFKKVAEIAVYVLVRVFNFIVHIIKQLFEYIFIFWQSVVDFIVNGWRVVIALVAKLGNTLLDFAHRKGPSNQAGITYNS
ncbi:MAG: hypothetical protein LBK74_01025 [Treponema sp.]|jgi:hypothetical protein|nr:hypothetical protein [Treponema sp.]